MSDGNFQDKSQEELFAPQSQRFDESHDSNNACESASDEPNPCENAEEKWNESVNNEPDKGELTSSVPQRKPVSRPFIMERHISYDSTSPYEGSSFLRMPSGYSKNRSQAQFGNGLEMDGEFGIQSTDESTDANQSESTSENQDAPEIMELGYNPDFSHDNCDCAPDNRGSFRRYNDTPRNRGGHDNMNSDYRRDFQGNYRTNYRNGYRGDYRNGYQNDHRGDERSPHRPYGGYRNGYNNGYGNNYGARRGYGNNGGEWNDSNNGMNPGYAGRNQYGKSCRRRNTEGYSAYNPAFPETMGGRLQKEPLSLAEEIADEMSSEHVEENNLKMQLRAETVGHLQKLSLAELIAEARRYEIGIPNEEHAKRQEIIFTILKEKIKLNGLLYGEGTLEILPDGFGFLRSKDTNYASCPDDIYVSPSQIRRFGLKTGTIVSGQIRPPKENERYFALLRVEAINFRDPSEFSRRRHFDNLTPMHPTERLRLEANADEIETRVLDMTVPIGFGQRGLIISPPRAGKTTLLKNIAHAALKNYQDLYVFILLIDERPEEVTEMRKQMKEQNCEVISSTFDEPTMRHTQVAEMVLEKAKRMVEYGQDVVILLDSITRLARMWNVVLPPGATPSSGLEPRALQLTKRFFASARCVEEGGSLTIIATALSETNSVIDQALLEEFQGNGNLEIVLERKLMEQRVWPAIDLSQSGTRREEMLLETEEFQAISRLRQLLSELNPVDAMEMLTNRLRKTKTNAEVLATIGGNHTEVARTVQETQNAEVTENADNAETVTNTETDSDAT